MYPNLKEKKRFNILYKASLELSKSGDVNFWIAQPKNSPYQKILKFNVCPTPRITYTDNQNNKIFYLPIKSTNNIKIEIKLQTVLSKYKINLEKIKISLPQKTSKTIKQYTKNERFLEQTSEIKKLAEIITKDSKTTIEKIKSIFLFVSKNFTYKYPVRKRGIKNFNLRNPKGDCGEYSTLFVALCRSIKIPAINKTGFIILPKKEKIVEHGWAAVYLKPYGWLDIDTQYASIEKNIKMGFKKYFCQRPEYRICFVSGFNIPLKPEITSNYKRDYWNDLGLPMTHNSVQVLQPIVFASQYKVKRFKDVIKLFN